MVARLDILGATLPKFYHLLELAQPQNDVIIPNYQVPF